MKKKAPLAALVILTLSLAIMAVSGVRMVSTRAELNQSEVTYEGDLELNSIDVKLLENGEETETLLSSLGNMEPGYSYEEVIAVRNPLDTEEFIRVIVTKSWQDASGKKLTTLKPDYIEIGYDDEEYNTAYWQENTSEASANGERKIYYLTKALEKGDSEPLFNHIRVNGRIAEEYEVQDPVEENGVKVIKVVYKYDGVQCVVEIEVQSLQTTSAAKAITGVWGTDNLSVNESTMEIEVK